MKWLLIVVTGVCDFKAWLAQRPKRVLESKMMKNRMLLIATAALVSAIALGGTDAGLEARIEALLSRMTLDEKIGQLQQTRGKESKALEAEDLSGEKKDDKFLADIRAGRYGSLLGRRGVKGYNMVQKAAMESRLGIPLLIGHDLIHSARSCFPIPLALSCAWDEDLWERTGEAIAVEAWTLGCNWTFTPMLDISPDARWGRIAESAGQDPLVASLFGAAMVRGIQGENMADGRHIAACAKHYVAYGASLGGLDYNAVEMSDSMLREIYLPPFKAAVDAGVATVMPAFHAYNGTPCSINRYLLTDILRGEFRFDGMTISDCDAIDNLVTGHGVALAGADAAAKSLNAGMDMEMCSTHYERGIKDALKTGALSLAAVDEAVRRILRTKFRLGLFEHPYIDVEKAEAAVDFPRNLALSRETAQKSTVLLKNDGVLPLKPGLKIALVGNVANDAGQMKGCWERGDFSNVTNTTLLAGLKADGADVAYSQCFRFEDRLDADALRRAAADADVVVAAFGEYWGRSGESRSCVSIEVHPVQLKALDILKKTGKPIVAVLFCGRPLAIPEIAEKADAVVLAWNPGGCGGWGVADVLTGVTEPYGRLTVDFPNATGECPKYYNRTTTGRPPAEDANKPDKVPRYRTHYMDAPVKSVYPFGLGLAYTTFEYSGENAKVSGDKVVFSADVKNTGFRRGSEVVQVYVRDVLADTARPRRELKGFKRMWLEPGATKHVEIEVPVASLGYWVNGRYRVEPGDFDAWIAPHSDAGRKLRFRLSADGKQRMQSHE